MIQVTAYEVVGAWQVHATRMEASSSGYQWMQLVSELVHPPAGVDGDAWDVLWLVGQLISERALERTAR